MFRRFIQVDSPVNTPRVELLRRDRAPPISPSAARTHPAAAKACLSCCLGFPRCRQCLTRAANRLSREMVQPASVPSLHPPKPMHPCSRTPSAMRKRCACIRSNMNVTVRPKYSLFRTRAQVLQACGAKVRGGTIAKDETESVWKPHLMVAACTLLSALCSASIARFTESPLIFQLALAVSGFVYGVTDNGVTMLTLWRWAHNSWRQRVDVAMLNAGFTIGALLTPMLVAVTMHGAGHNRWTFQPWRAAASSMVAPSSSPPCRPSNGAVIARCTGKLYYFAKDSGFSLQNDQNPNVPHLSSIGGIFTS